ncbi:MAG: RagB/SusD family nutrient uptake outer membrane protein [Algoriphagus sp.]|uniref:RagB/SusD family nutrient uptake outer membrane protein n=1 Tax=Algoriphagus sp. TaxID=1872435 RepID=UPI00272FA451|nr:RagB/SusD family nutrient uptake outer membrane protein [Algoriphagus sp.]MDP2039940.1 RagB/SusD family nutrient uptake outer membrane protein [Algoriphagus sp.]MDP3470341.1 RagB/SusD family nutrient uptake outer membrane protein [Algoriphagus sp.]
MKKLLYIISIVTICSCSHDFLEIYPVTTLNEGNFYQSQEQFIILANGCYIPLREYEKNTHWVISELISDNTSFQFNNVTGEAVRGVIDQFVITSDNRAYADFWNFSYNGINRCNKLLLEIERPEVKWSDLAYKNRSSGEALFLRALYYFNLVRQFGGVPLVLTPIGAPEALNIGRSSESDIYQSVIKDLNSAISQFEGATKIEENGRANLNSSYALLGKVYLTVKDYKNAETVLKKVIDSNKYSLLPNYADLFDSGKKDFKETIFSVQYSENNRELSNRFIFIFAPWTSGGNITMRPAINMISAGWNMPTSDLLNAFEAGDLRKDASIKIWNGRDWDGVTRDIPYTGKYKRPISAPDDRTGDNLPVLRYSDVLLMYAEALNEQGRTAEAIGYVQQVRTRAGLNAPLTGYDKSKLEGLIAKERQVEFCFENQRWYDLKRTGKAIEVMTAHGQREKAQKDFLFSSAYQIQPFKLLAPLPAEQILINNLEQNPGY